MIRKILVNDNIVDFDLGRIELTDSDLPLSRVERNILLFLVTNRNECFPASELCAQCEADSSGYIINCISKINRELETRFINNNKSIGYYVNADDFEIIKSDDDKTNTTLNRHVSTEEFMQIIEETCSLDVNFTIIENFRQDKEIDELVEIINLLNAEIINIIGRIEALGKYIPEDSEFAITFLKDKLKYNIEKYYYVSEKLSAKINDMQSNLCNAKSPSSSKTIAYRPAPNPTENINMENIYLLQNELWKFTNTLRNIDTVLFNIKSQWEENLKNHFQEIDELIVNNIEDTNV